MEIKKK